MRMIVASQTDGATVTGVYYLRTSYCGFRRWTWRAHSGDLYQGGRVLEKSAGCRELAVG